MHFLILLPFKKLFDEFGIYDHYLNCCVEIHINYPSSAFVGKLDSRMLGNDL